MSSQLYNDIGTGYSAIAPQWNQSRKKPLWAEVSSVLSRYMTRGVRVLDLWAGDGRWIDFFVPYMPSVYTAFDASEWLLEFAAGRFANARQTDDQQFQCVVGDARDLPFDPESYDVVLCSAMLHHVSVDDAREVLRHIARVLAPRGVAVVTVWNFFTHDKKMRDRRLEAWIRSRMFPDRYSDRDMLFFWQGGGDRVLRQYRAYTPQEFSDLCVSAGLCVVECHSGKNITVVLKKQN